MSFLLSFLSEIMGWIKDFFVDLPLYLLSLFLQGCATFINDLPVPSFFSDATGYIGSLPPLLLYCLAAMKIGQGIAIVLTAWGLRFLIRRIPFIG